MTNVELLLSALIPGWQDLDDVAQATIVGRQIDDAVGAQLDVLGELVGIARTTDDDDAYRRYIRTQIGINRSRGTTNDIVAVVRLALGPDFDGAKIVVDTVGVACFVLFIENAAVDEDLAALLFAFVDRARAAGVCFVLVYGTEDPELWSHFDVDVFDGDHVFTGAIG